KLLDEPDIVADSDKELAHTVSQKIPALERTAKDFPSNELAFSRVHCFANPKHPRRQVIQRGTDDSESRFRKTGQDIPGAFRDIPQIFQGLNPVFDPPVNVAGLVGLVDPVSEAFTNVGEPVTELGQVLRAACAETHQASSQ